MTLWTPPTPEGSTNVAFAGDSIVERTVAVVVCTVTDLRGLRMDLGIPIIAIGLPIIGIDEICRAADIPAVIIHIRRVFSRSVAVLVHPRARDLVSVRIRIGIGIVAVSATALRREISIFITIDGDVDTLVSFLVAGVFGAIEVICALRWGSTAATFDCVAGLCSCAPESVVTRFVRGRV